jgi:hypothetical protein
MICQLSGLPIEPGDRIAYYQDPDTGKVCAGLQICVEIHNHCLRKYSHREGMLFEFCCQLFVSDLFTFANFHSAKLIETAYLEGRKYRDKGAKRRGRH